MLCAAGLAVLGMAAPSASAQAPKALLVGPAGTPGAQYTSIQVAVDAAAPGDWVLVAPGVYHEKGSNDPEHPAGVIIKKPNIHLRGMNRNTVIVDGTNVVAGNASPTTMPAGSAACPSDDAHQDNGPLDSNMNPRGRNGILVLGRDSAGHKFLADGSYIENLSVCNFINTGGNGNEIWWNGGDGTGEIGMHSFWGDYLTATSTYYKDPSHGTGSYGIFTSNEDGPGVIDHSYASNMQDSGYYIGACPNCNAILRNSRGSSNADGFSGTNAGGNLVIQDNQFDHGRTGLTSNAQNNDDKPPPQKGQCPTGVIPAAGAAGCTYWIGNHVHHNNNPNTPGSGLTAVSAIGSGMEMVATQHNTLLNNIVDHQGSWGIMTFDFPDPETTANCNEGTYLPPISPQVCLWQSLGNIVANNQFSNNGYYGNVSNGDIADEAMYASTAAHPTAALDPNCFHDNHDAGGLTGYPDTPPLESLCGPGTLATTVQKGILAAQLVCATGADSLFTNGAVTTPCPNPEDPSLRPQYPQHDGVCGTEVSPGILTPAGDTRNGVCLLPLSTSLNQTTMPDPCAGTPPNAYCGTAVVTDTSLPNSSRAAAATGLGGLGAAAVLLALGIRQRRRRGARPTA